MNQKQIFPFIYKYIKEFISNYVSLPDMSDYIVAPELGSSAGIIGSLLIAQQAFETGRR